MPTYNVRYVRVTGGDDDLLMERQFFGGFGPWQDCAYYNNEVYRSQVKMNKIVEKLQEEYAKHTKLTKKRNQIHRSIKDATYQKEGVGFVDTAKLPFFRKDKKAMEKPPQTWLKFVQPIKQGSLEPEESLGLAVTYELAEDSAGSKAYEIKPTKQNMTKRQRQQQQQQQQNQQNNGQN